MQENSTGTLSRGEIAERIFEKFGKDFQSRAAVDRVVAGVFDEIVGAVEDGRGAQIDKLGSFSVVATSARMGRNPQTNEPMAIAAGLKVKYKAGKPMRDAASIGGVTKKS